MRALFVVLLLSLPLSGCLGGPDDPDGTPDVADAGALPEPVRIVEDAQGDAVMSARTFGCWAGDLVDPLCSTDASPGADSGVPAPAYTDILSVTLAETPTSLIVELELAAIDASFRTGPDQTQAFTAWSVCLHLEANVCRHWVSFAADRVQDTLQLDQWYSRTPGCEPRTCSADVGFTIVEGAPGALRWEVPRGFMPQSAMGDELGPWRVWTTHEPARIAAHTELEVRDARGSLRGVSVGSLVDTALSNATFRFATPPAPPAAAGLPTRSVTDVAGERRGQYNSRTDLDILEAHLVESPLNLTVATRVDRVDPVPQDHEFFAELEIRTEGFVRVGYSAFGGDRAAHARVCRNGFCLEVDERDHSLEVVPGSPGWINVTVGRSLLELTHQGDILTGLLVVMADDEHCAAIPLGEQESLAYCDRNAGDFLWDPPPFWFETGLAREGGADRPIAASMVDDVDDQNGVPLWGDDAYLDLISVSAAPAAPGSSEFVLGLRDIDAVTVPPTYTSIVYAVAVRTAGDAFMIAHYKAADADRGESFCASDTLVFDGRHQLPGRDFWRPVEAFISSGDSAGRGGPSSAGGAISFSVPHDCFGAEAAPVVPVLEMAGAVYMGRGADAAFDEADRVVHEAPFTLDTRAAVVQPPFLQRPFGIENFGDIFGAALAVLVAAVTVAVVVRRRRAMRRYLAEIHSLELEHGADPEALAGALVELRRRLHDDLMHHRISENHFPIVADRLRA